MVGMPFAIVAVPSFALEADRRHELRPADLLALDVGGVGLRAARDRLAAFEREPLSYLVGGEHGVELLVESLDDGARGGGGRQQSRSLRHFGAGQGGLGDGHCRCAPLRSDARVRSASLLRTCYSALAPDAFTTFDHCVSSRSISSAYCAGVDGSGSAPSIASRARTSSLASAVLSAALSFSMIARGVPGGATRP